MRAGAGAERQDDVRELLIAAHLVGRGTRNVQDLAPQRQDRLGLAIARLLGRAARTVALDKKDLSTGSTVAGAVGELARQAELAGRGLARQLALLPSPLTFFRPFDNSVEEQPRGCRIGAQPMIEMILDCVLDEPRRFARSEPLLGLTLELGVADEQRQQHRRVCRNVFSARLRDSAIVDQLAIP